MELILQNNLEHQQLPVEAVGDAMKDLTWQSPKDFFANPTWEDPQHRLNGNIFDVKDRLLHGRSKKFAAPEEDGPLNLDVKMETGTGKTYVYTKTIY